MIVYHDSSDEVQQKFANKIELYCLLHFIQFLMIWGVKREFLGIFIVKVHSPVPHLEKVSHTPFTPTQVTKICHILIKGAESITDVDSDTFWML